MKSQRHHFTACYSAVESYLEQRGVEMYEVVVEMRVRARVAQQVGVPERGQHAPPERRRHVGQPAARAPAHHHADARPAAARPARAPPRLLLALRPFWNTFNLDSRYIGRRSIAVPSVKLEPCLYKELFLLSARSNLIKP